jgi:hypothetical protein
MRKSLFSTIVFAIAFLILIVPCLMAAQPGLTPTGVQQKGVVANPQMQPSVIKQKNIELLQIGSMVITVRDSTGAPVSGATISTIIDSQPVTQVTNAQGEVSFMGIPSGQYSYSGSKAGYYAPTPTSSFSVGRGTTTTGNYFLFQYGSVKVKVTCNGVPVAGAGIDKYYNYKTERLNTDANGCALFENLVLGSYGFIASKNGYMSSKMESSNVVAGQEITIPLLMTQMGSARVKVTCEGVPVAGMNVSVTGYTTPLTLVTDTAGFTTFTNLAAGSHVFTTSKVDYINATATVTIVEGQEAAVPIAVTVNYGFLVVTVKDDNGAPVDGAAVSVLNYGDNKTYAATATPQGVASLGKMSIGNCYIKATRTGYGTTIAGASVSAAVTANKTTQAIYSMIRNNARIILSVKQDPAQVNQPSPVMLAGVTATLYSPNGTITQVTDSQGKTIFEKLYSGAYVLNITKAGYLGKSWSQSINTSASSLAYDLQMEMTATP